jgi:phage-related minor tail protein
MIRIGQTVETEISTAMSTAISAVVTGSGSVKQVLSDMFQNIGASFIKMATDIIAKQLVMITMQSILKALGGGAFGFSGGGPVSGASVFGAGQAGFNPAAFSMPALAANGATFANGTAKFAKGGVVSRPTFFKFANGGTMQNGVMGEAGPEAIVPLKRGTDGRLGIAQVPGAQGGDNRMRDMMGRSPAQAPAPVLNMKFETTSIGGVEYVSRDQLELAMAQTRRQAATDGAKRGMNMTLDKIQNSPQTRSRIGVR